MPAKRTRPRRRPVRPVTLAPRAALRGRVEPVTLFVPQAGQSPWVVRRPDGRERVIRYLDPEGDEPAEEHRHRFRLWRRRAAAV